MKGHYEDIKSPFRPLSLSLCTLSFMQSPIARSCADTGNQPNQPTALPTETEKIANNWKALSVDA